MNEPQTILLYKVALGAMSVMFLAVAVAAVARMMRSVGERPAGFLTSLNWLSAGYTTHAAMLGIIAYELVDHYAYGQPLNWPVILGAIGISRFRAGVARDVAPIEVKQDAILTGQKVLAAKVEVPNVPKTP